MTAAGRCHYCWSHPQPGQKRKPGCSGRSHCTQFTVCDVPHWGQNFASTGIIAVHAAFTHFLASCRFAAIFSYAMPPIENALPLYLMACCGATMRPSPPLPKPFHPHPFYLALAPALGSLVDGRCTTPIGIAMGPPVPAG